MDEVINYVMDTPGNTNPNILRGMLENSSNGSSGGGLVVHINFDYTDKNPIATLDKTGQEIIDAYPWVIFISEFDDGMGILGHFINQMESYEFYYTENFYVFHLNNNMDFYVTNLNDYPTNQEPEQAEDPGDQTLN